MLLLATVVGGCASHCPEVNVLRMALAERTAASEPHVVLSVPFVVADGLMQKEIRRVGPVPLTPPLLGPLETLLGRIVATPTHPRLTALDDGGLGLMLDVQIQHADDTWLSIGLTIRLRTEVADGVARILIRPADLRDVRPRLGAEAKEVLQKALAAAMPNLLEELIEPEVLAEIASSLAAYLGSEGYGVIRDHLLEHIGEIGSLRLSLPDLPLRRVRLRVAEASRLELVGMSDLPVRRGLSRVTAAPDRMQLTMSGSMMTELTNWAMDQGHLPSRYNSDMKADEDGSLSARLDWDPSATRPLKLHVFAEEPECVRVLVGARLTLSVKFGYVRSRVSEGEIESVDGSWRAQLGVWLGQLGRGPIDFTQKRAAHIDFKVADRAQRIIVDDIALTSETLAMRLRVVDD